MSQSYTIIPLSVQHLQPAVELFLEGYRQEREVNPLLPAGVLEEPGRIGSALKACLSSSVSEACSANDCGTLQRTSGIQKFRSGKRAIRSGSSTWSWSTVVTPFVYFSMRYIDSTG